jgi:hypothetical protein
VGVLAAADNGVRIAAMCVGAFTLAAAGVLDGWRATTLWQWAGELARRYPEIDVDPRVLFIDEGPVLMSAGVASGLDLHLLCQHAGADLAARTARRVVVPAWRDGVQALYVEHVGPADSDIRFNRRSTGWKRTHSTRSICRPSHTTHRWPSERSIANSGTTSAPPRWDCSRGCASTAHAGCWKPPG